MLIGGGAALAWSEVRTPTYEVPALIGQTEDGARAAVEPFGFDIERREVRRDGSTPGEVLETDPAEGERLEEGGTLVLAVSAGNTLAPVPADLVGRTLEDAGAALDAAGQFRAQPTEVESEEVPAGVVVEVGPDVPAELPKGSEVPLVVSKGPRPREIPGGQAGRTYEQAAAALEEVQLTPKKVEEFHDEVAAGVVIGLRPGSGTVPRDSEVEVVVSRGPELVEVPSVQGLTLDQAVAAIEGAGFVVGDAVGPAKGQPAQTDPAGGTMLRRGETVDIILRR